VAKKRGIPKKKAASAPIERITGRQDKFCREYIVDYHQTNAALRAGYSRKSAAVAACRLLKNDKILARVRELQQELNDQLVTSKAFVMTGLRRAYDRAMQAEQVLEFNYDSKQMEPTGEYTFDGRTANRALELMGKELGMFTDRVQMEGDVKIQVQMDYGDGNGE
jgi:Phage terminase, small subunit